MRRPKMGITVTLETEDGHRIASVEDPTNVLHRVLPEPEDARFHLANTIDWYGDTVFNPLQAGLLRKELAILIENAVDENAAMLLKRIDEILFKCNSEVHLYVRFCGD